MGEVEQLLSDCGDLRNDMSKCAKTRSVARTCIKVCHGVIDLKEENKRLERQIVELRAIIATGEGMPEGV